MSQSRPPTRLHVKVITHSALRSGTSITVWTVKVFVNSRLQSSKPFTSLDLGLNYRNHQCDYWSGRPDVWSVKANEFPIPLTRSFRSVGSGEPAHLVEKKLAKRWGTGMGVATHA